MKKIFQINNPLAPLSGGIKKPLTRGLGFCFLLFSIVFGVQSAPIETDFITANNDRGATPLIIDFEPTTNNSEYSYRWDFSNGETLFGKNITQIFSLPGDYDITLTQTDNNGIISTGSISITALDEPNCEADYDGDGFNNCEDLCPLVEGGTLNGGCPLLEEKCDASCGCSDGYSCNFNGDQRTCGTQGVCLPEKPKSSCYYDAEKNYLFGNAVCNSCPCKNKLEYNATIRMCDILFPAIVSPNGKDIYESGKFFEIK